jgi:hypothetical protein
MVAALICIVSLAAMVQVFVSYCRAALSSAGKAEVSERVLGLAGLEGGSVAAGDFVRFIQLLRLCAAYNADRMDVRAVDAYYRLLVVTGRACHALIPTATVWAERERESCSHFAAVVLDRCISSNRELRTHSASDEL